MANLISNRSPLSAFGSVLRKPKSFLSALAAPPPPPALPALQGKELAKHHLRLALAALHESGMTAPTRFRKIRLLINAMEQGHQLPQPSTPSNDEKILAPLRRRDRLISRAMATPLFSSMRAKA